MRDGHDTHGSFLDYVTEIEGMEEDMPLGIHTRLRMGDQGHVKDICSGADWFLENAGAGADVTVQWRRMAKYLESFLSNSGGRWNRQIQLRLWSIMTRGKEKRQRGCSSHPEYLFE